MFIHNNTKRIFMVENYQELKSSLQVIDSWKQEYPNDKPPTEATVLYTDLKPADFYLYWVILRQWCKTLCRKHWKI